jgi:ADP-heptose:LPS heptosyltransferase
VFPQADAVRRVRGLLEQNGISPGAPYAVLQPGARLAAMRWLAGKFAAIARWLRDAHGIASVVNLSEREGEIAAQVQHEMRDCAFVPAGLGVSELIALVAGARIFVGNDSGPAHVAAAAGRPSVVIFGATNPAQWRPWGVEHRVVNTGATFRALRGDKTIPISQRCSIEEVELNEVQAACGDLLAAPSSEINSDESKQA